MRKISLKVLLCFFKKSAGIAKENKRFSYLKIGLRRKNSIKKVALCNQLRKRKINSFRASKRPARAKASRRTERSLKALAHRTNVS